MNNAGVVALSQALQGGALPHLETLSLARNYISDDGARALAAAGNGMPKLRKLVLDQNEIGDAGVQALVQAVRDGAFASLRSLGFDGNPGSLTPMHAALAEREEARRSIK